jgi:hypothetical protein
MNTQRFFLAVIALFTGIYAGAYGALGKANACTGFSVVCVIAVIGACFPEEWPL